MLFDHNNATQREGLTTLAAALARSRMGASLPCAKSRGALSNCLKIPKCLFAVSKALPPRAHIASCRSVASQISCERGARPRSAFCLVACCKPLPPLRLTSLHRWIGRSPRPCPRSLVRRIRRHRRRRRTRPPGRASLAVARPSNGHLRNPTICRSSSRSRRRSSSRRSSRYSSCAPGLTTWMCTGLATVS